MTTITHASCANDTNDTKKVFLYFPLAEKIVKQKDEIVRKYRDKFYIHFYQYTGFQFRMS